LNYKFIVPAFVISLFIPIFEKKNTVLFILSDDIDRDTPKKNNYV